MSIVNCIICGDSREVLDELRDNSVDTYFTSSPYNFGMDYDVYDDKVDWDKYWDLIGDVMIKAYQKGKSGCRIGFNLHPDIKGEYATHVKLIELMEKIGWKWKFTILWYKGLGKTGTTAWGSWMSPTAPYCRQTWEYVEVFYKDQWKIEVKKADRDIGREEFMAWTDLYWNIAPETRMKKFNHPAMFPEELVVRFLKLFSFKGALVVDPFNGMGTTTKVAHDLKRRYIGIDLSEKYCRMAIKRIENGQGDLSRTYDGSYPVVRLRI